MVNRGLLLAQSDPLSSILIKVDGKAVFQHKFECDCGVTFIYKNAVLNEHKEKTP